MTANQSTPWLPFNAEDLLYHSKDNLLQISDDNYYKETLIIPLRKEIGGTIVK